uniref:Palmitoyltransferase n=1 Tax=Phallusia mammillata TaxID=59560 RepID=A0A6F9DXY1_9ASCI|nr:probable palmitoyltransferase ZDHHC16 [Phallusia mammillata]
MREIHFTCCSCLYSIKQYLQYLRLCHKSLTFNSFSSVTESLFEPVFCFVDFAVRWFGVAFVTVVICLVTSVVVIFYMNVIPFVFEIHSPIYAYVHVAYGHYLLAMILFNYYKAVTTDPGVPPNYSTNIPVTSICKRCIAPKPARTHHCSVCKKCRLKMDHHCPWLNNCVGHFNHRYFICFCIFMLLGTTYVSISSWALFRDCFRFFEKLFDIKKSIYSFFGSDVAEGIHGVKLRHALNINICAKKDRFFNSSTVFLWILCSAVTVALGCLTVWHILLITWGETSIEKLINDRERFRLKKLRLKFLNPYNFGYMGNWKKLLGFTDFRSFVLHVLLPSTHAPNEDGIVWTMASSVDPVHFETNNLSSCV